MQKSNEDCFYFLTSTCAKGPTCSYRHNPTVLTCNVICPAWSRGNCTDLTCPLRHSTIQRPAISNGITCFYENTPMGCRKLDCTYIHLRSRPNQRNSPTPRSSTTNLVNKDVIKPTPTPTPPPVINPIIEPAPPSPQIPPPQPPTPKVETPPVPEISPPTVKPAEVVPIKQSVPVDPPEKFSARTVVTRNVVVAEPNRKVVQSTTSNRVVVPSTKKTHDSDSDLDDLIEQENNSYKINGSIDISFPCSAPSITNRLFTSSKASSTPSNNDTKPIRLNRDRLPAPKISSANIISTSSNGEKTSAGTGLPQDDERRTNRIERFKKQPVSPPRSVVNVSPNERKRPASDQTIHDSLPSKRPSSQQEMNRHQNAATIGELCSPPTSPRRMHTRHHRRRRSSPPSSSSPSPPPLRKSPLRQSYSATSSMNESAWKREVDEFLAKTTQPKPVPLLSLRPRYIPSPSQLQPPPLMPRPRPRQPPPSVAIRRPLAPVIIPPEVSTKPAEPVPSIPDPPIINSKDEEENRLLGLDGPTDVVDTFALIDEVLLETDDFFELL